MGAASSGRPGDGSMKRTGDRSDRRASASQTTTEARMDSFRGHRYAPISRPRPGTESNSMRVPRFGTLLSAAVALATPARGQQIRCLSLAAGCTEAASGAEVAVSADGRFVAFVSISGDLVAGDTNGDLDVFVRDRTTGAIERVS